MSAYQAMGLLSIVFAFAVSYLVPTDPSVAAELSAGIEVAWQPLVLLALQTLWISCLSCLARAWFPARRFRFICIMTAYETICQRLEKK
jgi:predicted membrane protein